MTTWNVRAIRHKEEGENVVQVHGSAGLPVQGELLDAVVLEDGSLMIQNLSVTIEFLVIDKPT